MATFYVDVDFVMSRTLEVNADSEEHAISKVNNMINDNPYNYAHEFSHYVGHKVVGANEE